jgi:hypothetical protein
MEAAVWQKTLDSVLAMSDDEFNELLRFALSARSPERVDWSSGFPVSVDVADCTITVEQ